MELTQHVERDGCFFDITVRTRSTWAHKVLTEAEPLEKEALRENLRLDLEAFLNAVATRKGQLVDKR